MQKEKFNKILQKTLIYTIMISITLTLFLDWWVVPMMESFNYAMDFIDMDELTQMVAEDKADQILSELQNDVNNDIEITDEYAREFWLNARDEAGNTIHGMFLWLFSPFIATICMGYFAFKFSFKSSKYLDELITKSRTKIQNHR